MAYKNRSRLGKLPTLPKGGRVAGTVLSLWTDDKVQFAPPLLCMKVSRDPTSSVLLDIRNKIMTSFDRNNDDDIFQFYAMLGLVASCNDKPVDVQTLRQAFENGSPVRPWDLMYVSRGYVAHPDSFVLVESNSLGQGGHYWTLLWTN